MNKIGIAVFAWCLGAACVAQEQPDRTLGGFLNGYLELLNKDCPKHAAAVADAKAKGDVGAIVVTGQIYQTMCVCHPAKTRALLASLPKEKLSAPASGDNSFTTFAVPGIQTPCVGEQMHSMFEGKNCDGFKATDIQKGTRESAFCGCMKQETAAWSDTDAAALFQELGPYNASFRAAKSAKTPRPKRTPLVDRYISSLTKCGGGGEFMDSLPP